MDTAALFPELVGVSGRFTAIDVRYIAADRIIAMADDLGRIRLTRTDGAAPLVQA
jgi:hypothetical protein